MPKFKDMEGREWMVNLNVTVLKRIRSDLDFDPLDIDGGKALEKMMFDPVLLCNVLFLVCEKQAIDKGVTDEQFGESLGGDSIDDATKAYCEALADFTRNPRQRKILRKALSLYEMAKGKVLDRAETRLDEMDEAKLDEMIDVLMSGKSSTNSPESAE